LVAPNPVKMMKCIGIEANQENLQRERAFGAGR
jgi:hypothetical protein